jgi:hypothetical protein
MPRSLQAAALFLGLGLFCCSWGAASAARVYSPVLIHSNDVLGEIEPCGCRANPLGGMIRKEKLLKIRPELAHGLQLDAGDLFFSSNNIPSSLKNQAKIQAQALARALKITGLAATVPGEKDFSMGPEFYLQLIRQTGAQALAANLEVRQARSSKKAGWRSPFKPWAEFRIDLNKTQKDLKILRPIRVAVIGIVGNSLSYPEGIRASDPIKAAARWVTALRPKMDRIIVLSHQGFEADQSLARRVPGIDLIIGSHSQSFLQEPWIEGSTSIHQMSFRNQHLGLIRLDQGQEVVELAGTLDPQENEPSQIRSLLAETRVQIEKSVLEERRKAELEATKSGAPTGPEKYQTFVQCAECHVRQFDFWRKTPHSRAYEALANAGAQNHLECLSCHSVGLGDREGFRGPQDIARWHPHLKPKGTLQAWLADLRDARSANAALEVANQAKKVHATVQCENCHLPARDHPFSLINAFTPVATTSCLGCHTPARAPSWYGAEKGGKGKLDEALLKKKWNSVACPKTKDDS